MIVVVAVIALLANACLATYLVLSYRELRDEERWRGLR